MCLQQTLSHVKPGIPLLFILEHKFPTVKLLTQRVYVILALTDYLIVLEFYKVSFGVVYLKGGQGRGAAPGGSVG